MPEERHHGGGPRAVVGARHSRSLGKVLEVALSMGRKRNRCTILKVVLGDQEHAREIAADLRTRVWKRKKNLMVQTGPHSVM